MKLTKRRLLLRIRIDDQDITRLESIGQKMGMKTNVVASRLVNWFASQDPVMRERILGLRGPREAERAARVILDRIFR
jgi:hypothetical protein